MKPRGFTLVELVITITIMTILIALAVANLSSSQANQRDAERAADVATLAVNLETYYKSGITENGNAAQGRYPSTGLTIGGDSVVQKNLPDMDIQSAIPPGATSASGSFINATNTIETTAGVLPQPTTSQYIYQPILATGTLCTSGAQECRRFNIFYRTEIDNTVVKVSSKHQ